MTELLLAVQELGTTFWESLQTLLPIVFFFIIFQVFYLKLPREFFFRVGKGLLLSLLGLTFFLFGVNYGFLPAGEKMGIIMGGFSFRWIMIPVGFILGFMVTLAEPAVRVLSYEIDRSSAGYIPEKLVIYSMAAGVAGAVALGMLRIIYGLPIYYFIIPGYLLVIFILKFSSPTFTSIAFDAGGVATGPMITTFVVAITLGAAEFMEGRDPVVDGFGLISLVALLPIIITMLLGLIFQNYNNEEHYEEYKEADDIEKEEEQEGGRENNQSKVENHTKQRESSNKESNERKTDINEET